MGKKDKQPKRVTELFSKISNVRRFTLKYGKQFETLTDREVEVLTLVAKGMKNPVIAKSLNISRSTVQNHRSGIREKLSIESQADYIKYALAFGLISF